VNSPEALQPEESLHRVSASGSYSTPMLSGGNLALTALWGRNAAPHGSTDSFLAEVNADLDGGNIPFLRFEFVQKLGHDLVLPGDPEASSGVFQVQAGYVHRFTSAGPLVPTIGAVVDIGVVPDAVAGAYGANTPVGAFFFVGLQPPNMPADHEHHMSGM